MNQGGYLNDPEFINTVQRVQCGHNPDPVDPAPVARGISVYFTRFTYGGVRFVLLEDRKFKSGGDGLDDSGNPIPESELQLLGARQEAMLADLAAEGPGPATVVMSQTMYACVQTSTSRRKAGGSRSGWLAGPTPGPRPCSRWQPQEPFFCRGTPTSPRWSGTSMDRSSSVGQRVQPPSFVGSNPRSLARTPDLPATPVSSPTASVRVLAVANMHVDQATRVNATGTTTAAIRTSKRRATAC